MIYHDLDFFLLKSILNAKTKISPWRLSKMYDWEDKPTKFKNKKEEERYFTICNNRILKRLKIMEKEDLIIIFKNKGGRGDDYSIVGERVYVQRLKFCDGKKRNCLWIKEKNSAWQIFAVS